ncbi:hypothetical protein [Paenibacillus eucommiae]|uniref:Uncharacterized protein n=1 Tax=Paenibacillus eucommiae TaxID=1355755 RepID=A0ABS4J092_9BACL|nr:hypothetical protein [Paenibacillus eucommiae]MBP1992531.1 hypothetical protein [Paenibacillus eucommiae]
MNKKQSLINEKLSEIMLLCVLVNNHTDYCVFMNLSGHVDQISFRVCESKARWQRSLIEQEFYFSHNAPPKLNQKLDKIIDTLTEILKTNHIDFGKFKSVRTTHTTYAMFNA